MNARPQTKKKRRGFRSLAVTLTAVFLVVSLAILLVSSSLEIFFGYKQVQKNIAYQQQLIAREAADNVKNFITQKLDLLTTTIRLGRILSDAQLERKETVEKLLGLESSFRRIKLLDTGKTEVTGASRLSQFSQLRTSEELTNDLFTLLKRGEQFVGPVYIDTTSSEPMVIIAVPVTDVFGDFKGALIAEVNLKCMWELVDHITIGKTGTAYVVDRKGNLLAANDISRVLKGENVHRLKEVTQFINREYTSFKQTGDISTGIEKTNVVADYCELGIPDWAVVVELPVKEAFEPVFHLIRITGIIVLVCFLIAALLGAYLSKRISRPIIVLENAAAQIGEGRFDTCIEIPSNDEIGKLAQSINRMTRDLQQTTTSIDRLNQEIEVRRQTERALAESELNFRRMFEITSEGVALIRPATLRFIAANPAMCELFGYTEEEFLNLTVEDITPRETKEIMRQSMQTLADGCDLPDHEGTSVRKDGSKVNVIVSNRHMTWNGEPVYHVTFKNITYLKEIQQQLQKKNLEILEFTNMVTHDLRKPLTAMNSIFELAEMGALGELNDDGTLAVSTGMEASNYMQEMLEDLLTSARLESGTQEMVPEAIGFGELVATVTARLKYQLEAKNLQVDFKDDDIIVRADKKQMTRVLMNLVGNAVNYIGTGPDKRIRIGREQHGDATVFFVGDNGIGIPRDSQPQLFQKFKRGSNVANITGTGLGLSIVKSIIEAHNGKIWVASEEGKGTTFYFTLGCKTTNA